MLGLVTLDDFISRIPRFDLSGATVREVVEIVPYLSLHSTERASVETAFRFKVSDLGVDRRRVIAVQKLRDLRLRCAQVIPSPSDIRFELRTKQCKR